MSESTGMSQQTEALPAETLSNRLEELNRQIVSSMETAVQAFHQDLSGLTDQADSAGRQKAASAILDAIARIDGGDNQSSILIALLEEGRRFASRTAFFLLQPTQVVVWASRGFGDQEDSLAGQTLANGAPWTELAENDGSLSLDAAGCVEICQQLGIEDAAEAALIPFVIRGQLGGAFYADRLEDHGELLMEAIQLLTHNASQAVELVAFRNRGSSPALRRGQGSAADKLPVWQPEAEVAEPPADEPTPEIQAAADLAEPPAIEDQAADEPAVEEYEEPAEASVADAGGATADEAVEPEVVVTPEPAETLGSVEPAFDEVESAPMPAFAEPEISEPEPVSVDPEPTFAESESVAEPEPTFAEPEVVAEPEVIAEPEPAFAEPSLQDIESDSFGAPPTIEPTPEDLTNEAIPEPELEDTSTDIWSLEEDDDDDEEPTMVGQAVDVQQAVEPDPAPVVTPDPVPVVDPVAGMDSVGQETVRLDIAALQGQAASYAAEPTAVEPAAVTPVELEPPPPAAPPVETSFSQPETAYVPPPAIGTEDATVISPSPASFTDPASSGGFVPPPPEPKPEAPAGSNEVRPPEDHHGPGLAFSSAPSAGDEALHEEARRLARLLVSEIKLYNEEIIEEGKRHGDIYERLKDDIDRSRQMYQERIDPKLQGQDDYFYQELVQRLAGGDASLLGMS